MSGLIALKDQLLSDFHTPSLLLENSNQINASNDAQAIEAWLSEYAKSPATFRAYQKEAERFWLWCLIARQKRLAELKRDDFEVYNVFLENPSPRDLWCAPKGSKKRMRGSAGWRPFVGPLSASARRMAMGVIKSMMDYLVKADYLAKNPLALVRLREHTSQTERKLNTLERILDDEEWATFLTVLREMPQDTHAQRDTKERLFFLVSILFYLGLRIHELEGHTWASFRSLSGDWWFVVKGKGGKVGKIPVNQALLEAVKHYRRHLNLSELPGQEDTGPLLGSWRGTGALGARHMSRLLKQVANQAADLLHEKPLKATKLRRFSPHWLRHLSASMQDRAGIRFAHIKANHRHAREDTTRLYVHADDKERHDDMDKLKMSLSSI